MNPFLKDLFFKVYSSFPHPKKLIMLDDSFPDMHVGYRVAEFNHYLKFFPNSEVHTVCPDYEKALQLYEKHYPELVNRIHKFSSRHPLFPSLFYVVFLTKAYAFLPYIERERKPFILNMYTEGGFGIDNKKSDEMIKKVFSSPYFAHVIVSQKKTEQYLLAKKFCSKDKITFIYGAVPSEISFRNKLGKRFEFPHEKPSFDVCFVANKYMSSGADKGFDTFVSVCKQLQKENDIHFHVVGRGYSQSDFKGIRKDKFTYHGKMLFPDLVKFFLGMDCIISPTVPNTYAKGSFDGFPTGCTREAAYAGVAVFCTDELRLNTKFINGKEIVIVKPDASQIANKVLYYYKHPQALYKLAKAGEVKFRKVFDFDSQMNKRVSLIKRFL
jgi:hypothetical protein